MGNEMAALKASEYKSAIERHTAAALVEFPIDVDMRCRLFVAFLTGTLEYHDQKLAAKLRQVYLPVTEPDGGQQ